MTEKDQVSQKQRILGSLYSKRGAITLSDDNKLRQLQEGQAHTLHHITKSPSVTLSLPRDNSHT
jgi:hypothetical protein